MDCETGGLKPANNPLLEIGASAMNFDLEDIGDYDSLIKTYDPSKKIEQQALVANGLTLYDIEKGKDSKVVIEEFSNYLKSKKSGKNLPLICFHNADFDIGFLVEFFAFHKKDFSEFVNTDFILDTLWISRLKYKESTNYKLGTCCENAGVTLVNAHRAMTDVYATKELLKTYIRCLRSEGGSNEKRVRDTFKFEF